jgi:ornithine cyclodeaminase/alanine dehydrogenase-like protein (mu-crystallin family)
VLGTHVTDGGFHVKTAGFEKERFYYAAKINGNFPQNPVRHGLPTIQGVLSLHDARDGRLLALMDSMEITTIRTAAASAVAAKYLARSDSRIMMIIGCGIQGKSQLRAISRVCAIERAFASDVDAARAASFASDMSDAHGITVTAVPHYRDSLRECDIIVTCTPAREALIDREDVSPGTFIAAVGTDSEVKQEIAPGLLASSTVVADVLDQCALIGDLHHAFASGVMRREDVHAELADVVCAKRSGRTTREEITVFDSTGTALEDVAAAAVVYERAVSKGLGMEIALGA